MGLQLTPLRVTKVGSFPENGGASFNCWKSLSFCGMVSNASFPFKFNYGIGLPEDLEVEDAKNLLTIADLYLMEDLKEALAPVLGRSWTRTTSSRFPRWLRSLLRRS